MPEIEEEVSWYRPVSRMKNFLPRNKAKDDSQVPRRPRAIFRLKKGGDAVEESPRVRSARSPQHRNGTATLSGGGTQGIELDGERDVDGDVHEKSFVRRREKGLSQRITSVAKRSFSNVLNVGVSNPSTETPNHPSELENKISNEPELEVVSTSKLLSWVISPVRRGTDKQVPSDPLTSPEKASSAGDAVTMFSSAVQIPKSSHSGPVHSCAEADLDHMPIERSTVIQPAEEVLPPSRAYVHQAGGSAGYTSEILHRRKKTHGLKGKSASLRAGTYSKTMNSSDDEDDLNYPVNKRTLSVSAPNNNWFNLTVNPQARGETGDLATLSREASLRKKRRSYSDSGNSVKSPRSRATPDRARPNRRGSSSDSRDVGTGKENNPGIPLGSTKSASLRRVESLENRRVGSLENSSSRSTVAVDSDDYSQFMKERKRGLGRILSSRAPIVGSTVASASSPSVPREASMKSFREILNGSSKKFRNGDSGADHDGRNGDDVDNLAGEEPTLASPFNSAIRSREKLPP